MQVLVTQKCFHATDFFNYLECIFSTNPHSNFNSLWVFVIVPRLRTVQFDRCTITKLFVMDMQSWIPFVGTKFKFNCPNNFVTFIQNSVSL